MMLSSLLIRRGVCSGTGASPSLPAGRAVLIHIIPTISFLSCGPTGQPEAVSARIISI